MATKILPCTCSNDYQANLYGEKMRVHNSTGSSGKKSAKAKAEPINWRCTVCGNTRGG